LAELTTLRALFITPIPNLDSSAEEIKNTENSFQILVKHAGQYGIPTEIFEPKTPNFEKMTLYLNELNFKGRLTNRHNFEKLLILENFVTLE